VYFTNQGRTCHLLLEGPTARAVRETPDGKSTSSSDQSFPSGIPESYGRVVLKSGQQAEAIFEVVRTGNSRSEARKCQPERATGFVIEGYAKPISTAKFFHRGLAHVCFDSHVGTVTANTGVVWLKTD
jgi:hypothetical protein